MIKTTVVTSRAGAYPAELLLGKVYKVSGTFVHSSSVNLGWIDELRLDKHPNLYVVEYGSTVLPASICLLQTMEETEIYNLAAQCFIGSHLISQ